MESRAQEMFTQVSNKKKIETKNTGYQAKEVLKQMKITEFFPRNEEQEQREAEA